MPKPSVLVAVALTLASCAPVIETTYSYAPPGTDEGRHCVARCEVERAPCAQSCDRRERLCLNDADSRAMRDYQMELGDGLGRRRGGSGRTYFDYTGRYRALCSANGCRNTCDDTYRACFEGCGGTVTATQACTANCGT